MKKLKGSLEISLIYAIFSIIWILLSDKIVEFLFKNIKTLSMIQTFKGWIFVIITALMLYFLIENKISKEKKNEENLRIAKINAENSSKTKSIFLANISHELRTPLNGIVGMTQLIEMTEINSEQAEYINNLKISSDNLLKKINNIIEISKFGIKRYEVYDEVFNLKNFLFNVEKSFSNDIYLKNIEIILSLDQNIPTLIKSDKKKLFKILINLLDNAVKFTVKGKIQVKVNQIKSFSDTLLLEFSVKDTGIGIPKNKLELIFDSFSQADNSFTKKYQGAGIGLSIAKNLVEILGGEMKVESKEGQGSNFRFTLKVKKIREVTSA